MLTPTQPGKPTQDAYVERFNKTYRTEVLGCQVFDSPQEVLMPNNLNPHLLCKGV